MWIEIFRTGSQTDSSGRTEEYTPEVLDSIASLYNRKVAEDPSFEAPVVKGHPNTDDPAYGWVERLFRKGNVLLAKLKDVQPEFINEVNCQLFRRVSIALYPDKMLRHVGFLGAAAPAVQGLRNVKFNDESAFSEIISEEPTFPNYPDEPANASPGQPGPEPTQPETNDTAQRLASLEQENASLASLNNEYRQKILLLEKEARLKEYRSFANSLIEDPRGSVITPAQADDLVDIMESAFSADSMFTSPDGADPGQFTHPPESATLSKIKRFMSSLKPLLALGEFSANPRLPSLQSAPGSARDPIPDFTGMNLLPSRLDLHNKALELIDQSPGLSYEEAVCQAARLKF